LKIANQTLKETSGMRLPKWIAEETRKSRGGREVKKRLRSHGLHTVCEEARCPNQGRCFSKSTAAFLILGDNCTRRCGFCAVGHGALEPVDPDEPRRVAETAKELGLNYVVVTSVTRDDLPDGGAGQFAETIRQIRRFTPEAKVEVLIPDFKGDERALEIVLSACPDVFNHNIETVGHLYSLVRPQADYRRSLGVLKSAKKISPGITTKSGLMVGLGESFEDVKAVLKDLRTTDCDCLTIGQYLRPRRSNLPVKEYVRPEVFKEYGLLAKTMGFKKVSSAPLVRSSMDAEELTTYA